MKNMTVGVPDEVVARAKVEVARRGGSSFRLGARTGFRVLVDPFLASPADVLRQR